MSVINAATTEVGIHHIQKQVDNCDSIVSKNDIIERNILPIYKIYQQKLTELNSCDFGDLILHVVKILEK